MRLLKSLTSVLACLMLVLYPCQGIAEQAKEPQSVTVGLAAVRSQAGTEASQTLTEDLLQQLPSGSRIDVYDAYNLQRVASLRVSKDPRSRSRMRDIQRQPDYRKLRAFLSRNRTVKNSGEDEVRVPQFLSLVASSVHRDDMPNRVLVIGDPYYKDKRDANDVFGNGTIPRDDNLKAKRGQTIYAPQGETLKGVAVDWCTIADRYPDSKEAYAVRRFWSLYAHHGHAATLTTISPSTDVIFERILNSVTEPALEVEIDPMDQGLGVRPIHPPKKVDPPKQPEPQTKPGVQEPQEVNEPQPLPQAPPEVAEPVEVVQIPEAPTLVAPDLSAKPNIEDKIAVTVDMAIAHDASDSMEDELLRAFEIITGVTDLGRELTPSFSTSVIIYRGKDFYNTFGPAKISPDVDGKADPGAEELMSFMRTPSVKIIKLRGSKGETAGEPAGEKGVITPLEPTVGYIDIEGAVSRGLAMLERGNGDRKILVVVGDAGPSEYDQQVGMSQADKESSVRAQNKLKAFIADHPDTRVVMLYSGPSPKDHNFTKTHADAIAFFKALAEICGERGIYLDDADKLEQSVQAALLNN